MQCPCGNSVVTDGDFECERGRSHFHPWSGGGLLVSPCGSFMWRQEGERWEVVTESTGPKVQDGPDKPVQVVTVSPSGRKMVITVQVVIAFDADMDDQ